MITLHVDSEVPAGTSGGHPAEAGCLVYPPPNPYLDALRRAVLALHGVMVKACYSGHWSAVPACLDALIAEHRLVLDHLVRTASEAKCLLGTVPGPAHVLITELGAAEAIRFAERGVRKFYLPLDYTSDVAQMTSAILEDKLTNPKRHLMVWQKYGKFQAFVNIIARNEASDLAVREHRQSGRRLIDLFRDEPDETTPPEA